MWVSITISPLIFLKDPGGILDRNKYAKRGYLAPLNLIELVSKKIWEVKPRRLSLQLL